MVDVPHLAEERDAHVSVSVGEDVDLLRVVNRQSRAGSARRDLLSTSFDVFDITNDRSTESLPHRVAGPRLPPAPIELTELLCVGVRFDVATPSTDQEFTMTLAGILRAGGHRPRSRFISRKAVSGTLALFRETNAVVSTAADTRDSGPASCGHGFCVLRGSMTTKPRLLLRAEGRVTAVSSDGRTSCP
jgi:hypothetical protein